MKRIYFLFIILFFCALACEAQVSETTTVYEQINQIRKDRGLEPLEVSTVLELKGARWLKKMHQSRIGGLYHDSMSREAELLTDCDDPVLCWMRSKAHRKILLSKDYKRIGIVLVEGDWCARLD